jgi:hypothetical protein
MTRPTATCSGLQGNNSACPRREQCQRYLHWYQPGGENSVFNLCLSGGKAFPQFIRKNSEQALPPRTGQLDLFQGIRP